MTPTDNDMDAGRPLDRNAGDGAARMFDHHRQQLSALMDGELPADEARFLLRRLEHDAELLGCWDRWQLAGDVLRGRRDRLARPGFVVNVATAIDGGAVVASRQRRWLRWGGGAALAASTAMIALLLARQASDVAPRDAVQAHPVATTPAPVLPAPSDRVVPAAPNPNPSPRSGELATAVAIADVPRRLIARRARGQSQRAASRHDRLLARAQAPRAAGVSGDAGAPAMSAVDPFSGQRISLQAHPWPRALLPRSPSGGTFTVDFGRGNLPPPTVYPFAPREPDAKAADTGH